MLPGVCIDPSLPEPSIFRECRSLSRNGHSGYDHVGLDNSRILELLRPNGELSPVQVQQISTYIEILLRWNAKMNLTSIREPEQIVKRHFGEALFLARQLSDRNLLPADAKVVDVGSGAGFPGVPLKIACPQISLTLVEAHGRKAIFLKEVLRAINLDANVKNVRAEVLAETAASSAEVVTLRAVERFESVLQTAARFVKPNGKMALLIGKQQISIAQNLLKSWHSEPFLPLSGSESRGILLLNQGS